MTFLSTQELAERWKTTKAYLANRRSQGLGPEYIKVGAKVLYPVEDLEVFEARQKGSQGEDSTDV